MNEIKLLPCPFCGSEKLKLESKNGRIHYHEKDGMREWQNVVFSVRCNSFHAIGSTTSADLPTMGMHKDYVAKKTDAIERAIKAWNTRKPIEDMVEQLSEKSVETIPTCAVDGYSMTEEEKMVFLDDAIDIVRGGRE